MTPDMGLGGLAVCLLLSYIVSSLALLVVRVWSKMRLLNRMPRATSPGFLGWLMGWTELIYDGEHGPHLTSKIAIERGGICSYRLLHFTGVVVTNPVLAQQVLRILDLQKSENIYRVFNALTSPDGKEPNLLGHYTHSGWWKLVRKGTAPAFAPKHIRAEYPHVVELSNVICDILSSAGTNVYIDLDNLLQRESMDVIGRIGFACEFGALQGFKLEHGPHSSVGAETAGEGGHYYASTVLEPGDVFEVVRAAGTEMVRRWVSPVRWYLKHILPDARRGTRSLQAFQALMLRLMKEIRARGEPDPSDMSVAAHLLRVKDPATGKGLSDSQLTSHIGAFFFAGYETTGHTMAWTLYFLATHPEAESKVCAELDALGLLCTSDRPNPRPLAYDDLGKLTYLGCCIKEAMRRVPVVGAGSPRTSTKPFQLGPYTIPAGVDIIVPLQGLMNSPDNWDRPEEYVPERIGSASGEKEGGKHSSPKCAAAPAAPAAKAGEYGILEEEESTETALPPRRFIPFSDGVRNCLGQNLAKMNYTATLAILLSRFTFELPPELRAPGALWDLTCFRTTMQPKDGLPLRCIPRGGS